jgi:hypothetical protein
VNLKLIIILLLALLGVNLYILYRIRNQPGQVVYVPMSIELENDEIEIETADVDSSWDYAHLPGIDPDQMH